MHILHKQSKKPVNTPVREKLRFLPIRLSDKVRHCVEERSILDFKQQYFQIWTDAWGLHKKYSGTSADSEKAWQQLDGECEALDAKYKGTSEQVFLQSLLLAVCAELERSARDAEKKQTQHTAEQP